jgi:hypothetical protein
MIELPKDAEGREISLNTDVLFDKDGKEVEVSRWQYYPRVGPGYWNLKSDRNKFYRQDEVYLTPPDSWEKLEEDLDEIINGNDVHIVCCKYFGADGKDCEECPQFSYDDCDKKMLKDIASRIRKLRGEN